MTFKEFTNEKADGPSAGLAVRPEQEAGQEAGHGMTPFMDFGRGEEELESLVAQLEEDQAVQIANRPARRPTMPSKISVHNRALFKHPCQATRTTGTRWAEPPSLRRPAARSSPATPGTGAVLHRFSTELCTVQLPTPGHPGRPLPALQSRHRRLQGDRQQ